MSVRVQVSFPDDMYAEIKAAADKDAFPLSLYVRTLAYKQFQGEKQLREMTRLMQGMTSDQFKAILPSMPDAGAPPADM